MAGITLSKKRIDSLLGKKLTPEQLEERLVMLGIGVDKVSAEEIVIEVTPNRPDYLHEQGVVRGLKAFLGLKKGLKTYSAAKSSYEVHIDASVAKVRPYTACAVITGLSFDDAAIRSIIQFQEKLHATFCRNRKKAAIGVYPLEAIAWPIRYTARRPEDIKFQPLEAGRQMTGKQILEHHPTGKLYAHLLADKDKYPIFIDGKDSILSMPPVINSEQTGRVTSATKDVFIECSGFDQRNLQQLLNIIVTALADAGGKLHEVTLKYGTKKLVTPDLTPETRKFTVANANALLGTTLSDADARKLLEKMGYGSKGTELLIPAYRTDVLHERDVIEDLAIASGYDSIKPVIPDVATVAQESAQHLFNKKIVELLVGMGMLETNTFQLTSIAAQTTQMQAEMPLVELANSLNSEYNALRAWMLPSLMDVLKTNKHHDYPHKLFGIGTVFQHDKSQETGVSEKPHLAIVTSHPKADYTEVRQVLEYLLDRLGLVPAINELTFGSVIPGRAAEFKIDKKLVARVGEIHPQVLRNWELEQPVAAIEIDLQTLFELVKKS